jgi:hypothetical protein
MGFAGCPPQDFWPVSAGIWFVFSHDRVDLGCFEHLPSPRLRRDWRKETEATETVTNKESIFFPETLE